jgi:hypothetical protein
MIVCFCCNAIYRSWRKKKKMLFLAVLRVSAGDKMYNKSGSHNKNRHSMVKQGIWK